MRKLQTITMGLLAAALTLSVHAADAPADASAKAPANPFTLSTNAFLDKGMIPVLYTCDGKDISLEFEWTNPPAKTKTFALIVSDKDAPGGTFYHWVVYNLPETTKTIAEGEQKLPPGTMIGTNSFNKQQYNGPCPPKDTTHNYVFSLYALDTKLNLPTGADAKTVLNAMQKHILGTAELNAVYSRWIT